MITDGPPPRGIAARLARHLPETIAINPERSLIDIGCALIGLSALFETGHGVLAHLWPFASYEWGAAMLLGGVAALWGLFHRLRSVERLGQLLILFGSLFFAVVLLTEFSVHAIPTALIFLGIGAAMVVRLIVGAAVRSQIIQLSEQMTKEADEPGGES